MAEWRTTLVGTYRCPVCGHYDHAELSRVNTYRMVTCSYCGRLLEVSSRGTGSLWFSVQVAGEAATK